MNKRVLMIVTVFLAAVVSAGTSFTSHAAEAGMEQTLPDEQYNTMLIEERNNPEQRCLDMVRVVELVNIERSNQGLLPLELDTDVTMAAEIRVMEIMQNFDHSRPDGSRFFTVLFELGIPIRTAGENIACGYHTPEEVMAAWMNSRCHRANILNPNYTKIGISVYADENGRCYWSQLFVG